VLDLALTAGERSKLPPATRRFVEQQVTLDGELKVFHVDYEDGHSEYVTKLAKGGQETPLALGAGIGPARPGDQVRLSGVALAGDSTVVTDQMAVIQSLSAAGTTGNQRTAIILAAGSGVASHTYANTTNTASIFFSSSNPGSARNFYLEASYGQTVIVGGNGAEGTAADVYGPYSIAASTCDTNTIRSQAFAAADPSLNFSTYDRIVISVITTPGAGCGNGGVGTVRSQYQGVFDGQGQYLSVSWNFNNAMGSTAFNGKIGGVALHEYGHNLGIWHANSLDCGTGAIGANVCYSTEYGDPSDVMGSSSGFGHPNGAHKDTLAWLGNNRAQTVSSSGSYQLNVYEDGSDNTKVLRIPRTRDASGGVNGYYYLEYRKPSSTWNGFLTNRAEYGTGVLVHTSGATPLCTSFCGPDFSGSGGGGDSNIVDTAPASGYGSADFNDAPLSLNESYADEAAGVTFQVTATSPTSAMVQVTIGTPLRTVRTVVYPASAGTVDANGMTFSPGQSVTLTAQPAGCFVRWRENRANQSYPNPYTFTIQGDRLLEAVFSSSTCAPAPANDAFPGTSVSTGQHVALNYGATTEAGEPTTFNCDGANVTLGKTAWYTYTPTVTSQVTLSTAGSNFDTIMRVYSGGAVGALTPVACNDDIVNNANLMSQVQFAAQAGTPYRIQIGGYHNSGNGTTASGNLILNVSSAAQESDPRQEGAIGVSGNLSVGGAATLTVAVKNHGGIPTPAIFPIVDGTNAAGGSWRADTSSPASAVIQPGQTVTFTLTEPLNSAGTWTGGSIILWNADANALWKALPANGNSQQVSFQVTVSCSPRPKVNLSTSVNGDGRLTVTLAVANAEAGNRLTSLQFGPDSRTPNPNALIDLPGIGNGRTVPTTVQLPGTPSSYTFYVRRQVPGVPVTLPITVTDGCGTWQTIVGGGTDAGF
jgi:M6 family metalloprotease-like protein